MADPIKVLFINFPPHPIGEIEPAFRGKSEIVDVPVIPLGICYLSANLKSRVKNVDVRLIDYAMIMAMRAHEFTSVDEFIKKPGEDLSGDFSPDIIGFSMLFSVCHPLFIIAATELKKVWPNAVMITGGNHATNSVDVITQHPDIDYVAKGECELAFSQFVENFHQRADLNIKGIYSRQHVINKLPMPHAEAVENLDELGFPDWDILDIEAYAATPLKRSRTAANVKESRELSILTTRGCSFSCTFCAVHTTMGKKVRFRSVGHVIEEMKTLWDRYQINLFSIEDDLFTANRKRVLPLLSAMKCLGASIPNFETTFPSALSVNTLFDDVMDALIDAGMKVTNVAIESGSKHVQRNIIKKNCNLDRALEVVKYFRDRGVFTRCYFIGGFPGETKEMLDETREYAKKIKSDWACFGIAAPLRGSEMYDQFVHAGYIKDDIEQWSSAFYSERIFDTPEIGAEEIKDFFYRTNLEVNFLNNPQFLTGKWTDCIEIFENILSGHPYHIFAWYIIMKSYIGLNQLADAAIAERQIFELVKNDERATRLYERYGYMLGDIAIPGFQKNKRETDYFTVPEAPILDEEEMRVKPIMHNVG